MNRTLNGVALLFAALLFAVTFSAAGAATLTATNATLAAQLKAVADAGGGTVACPACTGNIAIGNTAAPALDFKGATLDLTGANVGYLYLVKVSNLTIKGGAFSPAAGDWHGCVYFSGFSQVSVVNATCHAGAISFRGGDGATVNGAMIDNSPGVGVYFGGVTHFEAANVWTRASGGDGIDVAGSSFGRIHDSKCTDNDLTGIHPDCVQLFAPIAPYPTISHDIEIDHNSAVGATQGFSAFQAAANANVHDNDVFTSLPNALGFYSCTNCTVARNRIGTLPGATWPAVINTPGLVGTRCGNVVNGVAEAACK